MKLSWWLLFAALPLLLMQVGKSRAAEVVGVYALQDPGHPIPDAVLNNPNVDGVALRYPWFALERSQGAYNWGPVDREIERDAAHGKKVSITIGAGRFTPPWVLNQGVKLYSFAWRMRGAGPCREITLPVPWDPVFMSRWQDFVRAAGAHYDANPAIVAVKIQGVQSNSPELILPRDGPWGGCPNGDRNANWVRAGYTRQRVIQTWQTYANTYAAAFAHKGLVLEITPDGLPPIDDFGRLTGARSDEVGVPQIIALGMKDYASRLILQNDGISAVWNWDLLAHLAPRVAVGYQTVWSATDDPQCWMNRMVAPCDPATMLRGTVDRAVNAGASYMEIYLADLQNPALSAIVADANRRLMAHAHASDPPTLTSARDD